MILSLEIITNIAVGYIFSQCITIDPQKPCAAYMERMKQVKELKLFR
jgi:hypothetical protein